MLILTGEIKRECSQKIFIVTVHTGNVLHYKYIVKALWEVVPNLYLAYIVHYSHRNRLRISLNVWKY